MEMISTQNTLDVIVNSSLKQKLNLLLGHTYLANIFEITDDGKVIIQIGDTKLLADSKVSLQPGEKIFVEVKESNNKLLLLQIINNSESQETEKNQQILFRNSIIETLNKLKIPTKEENIGISGKLIKYNLSVSNENIHKVINNLISAGYKESLKDINVLDKGVMLFSKGLPITTETMELIDFLRGNKGQVTGKIAAIEESLNNVLKNLENESVISETGEKIVTNYLFAKNDNFNIGSLTLKNPGISSNELEQVNKIFNESVNESINKETKQNAVRPNYLVERMGPSENSQDVTVTNDDFFKSNRSTHQEFMLDNIGKNIIPNLSEKNNIYEEGINLLDTQNLTSNKKQEVISSIVILKNIISDLILKIDPSNINLDKQIDVIKNLANLVTIGSKDLEAFIKEKFNLKKEDIITLISDKLTGERELSQNSNLQHNNIIRVLQEPNNLLGQNFNELNKHFDAMKLYNSSNNENNNYYLLPLPIEVAGEKYENKLYFWSQGNKQNKIDSNNMRVVFILNTQNLGLIKIDLSVVKRDIYAGIEVSNSEVKEELDKYKTRLKEQLATINYGLKRMDCEIKKEDIIVTNQDNYMSDKDFTTLDLRI